MDEDNDNVEIGKVEIEGPRIPHGILENFVVS